MSGYYVDRPSPAAVLSAMILIGLSLLDALLSLRLFSLGTYYEFNPLLALVLDRGTGTFLLVKAAATVSAALVLVVHWNFVFAGRVSLPTLTRVLVRLYVSIVAYEIVLLTQG